MVLYTSNEVVINVEEAIIIPPPPLPPPSQVSVRLSADKTRCYVGDTINFTVTVTGLDGWFQIALIAKGRGAIAITAQPLTKAGTTVRIPWTPWEPGVYTIYAEVGALL
ncbi:MAG: hypothetical protein QW794_08330 [Thermosphaera sp.]